VSERLLELGIRGQLMAADLVSAAVSRARGERGQTTVEWIALMVGLAALVTVLAGRNIWHQAGQAIVDAVNGIFGSSNDKV
jgi:Flp pilus assembly pilin Flp